ncbi:MAG: hypothetical protein CO094_03690 [Anaerolineae bacterium CG_4_9_14_3_um_filter_57_17]|nr:hypothetical protein [bacterium]NCT20254.1 hypothetical protein [bacterium]OIO84739.1 MAG: hypothetical protein AUK01_07925 [Anaerolineae bacterium CG2_30_57_67]PJB67525.1 MAG: hypothetical protein CO094_03690 [Anaerolineae bacterium CG_4_9_14_3_um_filter_57_17]
MTQWISKLLDSASEFFAHRKGLLPLAGLALIVVNLILASLLPADNYLVRANLFLHLGLLLAIFGLMLSWAL